MTHSSQFVSGGIALILLLTSGCAGNGLRNMFSRNETEGYKTLEELEAEEAEAEAEADESEVADADSSEPRFAPWLPFGKKPIEETDALASADESEADTEESAKAGWWPNPFRKRELFETDPFLAESEQKTSTVANTETTVEPKSKSGTSEGKTAEQDAMKKLTEQSREKKNVKAVSTAAESDEDVDADLVEKFEKHFQQETAEAAKVAEQAEPLIVASSQRKATTRATTASADTAAADKLDELERLLAEKKPATAKRSTREPAFARESGALDESSDEFFAAASELKTAGHKQVQGASNRVSQTVDSFDSLLGQSQDSASNTKSATGTAESRSQPSTGSDPRTRDVSVADAASLFGPTVTATMKNVADASGITGGNGWSGNSAGTDGFRWSQSESAGESQNNNPGPDSVESRVTKFAAKFANGRKAEPLPPAALPDAPESAVRAPNGTLAQREDSRKSNQNRNAVRPVSASRELPGGASPSDLADDGFFTKAPVGTAADSFSAETLASANAALAPQSTTGSSASTGFGGRNWLLLLGGIIVVALLFAPGRKKPLQAG